MEDVLHGVRMQDKLRTEEIPEGPYLAAVFSSDDDVSSAATPVLMAVVRSKSSDFESGGRCIWLS
jgi:hypothetical protein